MPVTTFPKYTASNYRTGQNANEYYCYGPGVFTLSSNDQTKETRIRPDSYFLCRKIHSIPAELPTRYVTNLWNGIISSAPNPTMRLFNGKNGRFYQSVPVSFVTLGGHAASPNILAAPILFEPSSVLSMQYLNGSGTKMALCYEGEKIYNPDPAWVQKMNSRFWYQYAVIDTSSNQTLTLNLDMKDPRYDFAICKFLSYNLFNGSGISGVKGRLRIREKGPNNMYWSNIDIPDRNYAGTYGEGFGAHHFLPPIIVPGTSQVEIYWKTSATTINFNDFVFDGIKFPRGTNLEDWL